MKQQKKIFQSPWIEAMLLEAGAALVTTIDYVAITTSHPQLRTLHPSTLSERFLQGSQEKFDAMVTGFDRSKKPTFSVKAMQIAEEKQAVAQYGSSDSGASLGDILGAALNKARTGE